MTDDHWSPTYRIPERKPTPSELLFEFVRPSHGATMSCELRFCGEGDATRRGSFEWGELHVSHGAYTGGVVGRIPKQRKQM